MYSDKTLAVIDDNLMDILDFAHQGKSHQEYLTDIARQCDEDITSVYEAILYRLALTAKSEVNCSMNVPHIRSSMSRLVMNPHVHNDHLLVDRRTYDSGATNDKVLRLVKYFRVSDSVLSVTSEVTEIMRETLINRKRLESYQVAKLPVSVSIVIEYYQLVLCKNEYSVTFPSERYVEGLKDVLESYQWADRENAYDIATMVLSNGKMFLKAYEYELSSNTTRPVKRDAERIVEPLTNTDDDPSNFTYVNTPERHDMLNEVFYNTIKLVQQSGDKALKLTLKSSIEDGYLKTYDQPIDNKTMNYLKLIKEH